MGRSGTVTGGPEVDHSLNWDLPPARCVHRNRAWDLLDAILDGKLTLSEHYEAWSGDDLEGLRPRSAILALTVYRASWGSVGADRARSDGEK